LFAPCSGLGEKNNLRNLNEASFDKQLSSKDTGRTYEDALKGFRRELQNTTTTPTTPAPTVPVTNAPTATPFTLADLFSVLLDIFSAGINIVVLLASLIGVELDPAFLFTAQPTPTPTISGIPSLAPVTQTPTLIPSTHPTETIDFVWEKRFTTPGVKATVSGSGDVFFRFEENGHAQIYAKGFNGDWNLQSDSDLISDIFGTDNTNLQVSLSGAKNLIVGNFDLGQVLVFTISGGTFWNIRGGIISSDDINKFGSFVDIDNSGQRIMVGGTSDMIVYQFAGTWNEVGRKSTNDFIIGAYMSEKGDEAFYYSLTNLQRYSLPNFDPLNTISIHPDTTIAQISLNGGGSLFALGLENMTMWDQGTARFSTHIYSTEGSNGEYVLEADLPEQLVTYNSMSVDGRTIVTFDLTKPTTDGFVFGTFKRSGTSWKKKDTFQPNIGFGFTLECSVDRDGTTFVIAANGNVEAWDYVSVESLTTTDPPTTSAAPSISATAFPTLVPSIGVSSSEPTSIPSSLATVSPQPSTSSFPTLVPSSMPTLSRNLTWNKTFVDNGVEVELSGDGKTLLLFQSSGTVKIFNRNEGSSGWTNIINTNNLGLIWGDLADAIPKVSLDATGEWIAAGSEKFNQLLIFENKFTQWELIDIIADTGSSDFGKFVGISVNGTYVLGGGASGLKSYEFNATNSSYYETGSETTVEVLDALFTANGDAAFYYTEKEFFHVSIPSFAQLPTIELEPNVGIAQASFSSSCETVVISTYDFNVTNATNSSKFPGARKTDDENDDYMYYGEWERFNLYVYTIGDTAVTLDLTLPRQFAAFNSISGDGTRLITMDLETESDDGFDFRSWVNIDGVWMQTGTFHPDTGDDSSYDCVISESGLTYASSFSGLVNVWEVV